MTWFKAMKMASQEFILKDWSGEEARKIIEFQSKATF